jgi:propanol-preferring alcohol dehydrogenase
MCAGLTSYKGIKECDIKPGEFLTIIGAAGGLGHLAIQYAVAMGFRVIAVDVGEDKLNYCKSVGAEFAVDAFDKSFVESVDKITSGGSHGVLCLAPNPNAFLSSIKIARRKGTVVCISLPPGSFETPIFDVVLKRITIRGSIVGTRKDLIEALDFAARGLIKCSVSLRSIDTINEIFDELKHEKVQGRIVLDITGDCSCCHKK